MAALAGEGVHANDDVNMGQSSNDVFPSAVHLAALDETVNDLLPALDGLAATLQAKAEEFADVVKSGRTHWMDAVPVTLGQEFGGYAAQVREGKARVVVDARPARPDPARRHRRRHRPEHASGVRRARPRQARRRQRPRDLSARRRIRVAGCARRARRGLGRAEDARGQPDEDRQRPALPRLRAARRPVGDLPAGAAEGLVDHAGQGQPGHPRGRHAGRRPGDRQRPGDRDRRHAGPLRAERLRAADGAQPAAVDQAARLGVPAARREVRRRDRGEPRAVRELRRADPLGRDGPEPVHRVRQGRGDRQEGLARQASHCARSPLRKVSTRRSSTTRSTTARWPTRTAEPAAPSRRRRRGR